MTPLLDRAASYFQALQDRICAGLESLEGAEGGRFVEDGWRREGGGGGRTRVLSGGTVFEKAGVNFSDVYGEFDEDFARGLPGQARTFRATGISLVLHPRNPHVPTVHANFRRIEQGERGWFGGGADLTPYYVVDEDAIHFHETLRAACDLHDRTLYPRFKRWCDRYFYLRHRQEPRGIGGLFFDYLGAGAEAAAQVEEQGIKGGSVTIAQSALEADPEALFAFVRSVGDSFLDAYCPIVKRRRAEPYGAREREWQLHRRGRYVEFNLVYDRGTIFGLRTGGRTESILMSLPSEVRWTYGYAPEAGSPEARSLAAIVAARDWADAGGKGPG